MAMVTASERVLAPWPRHPALSRCTHVHRSAPQAFLLNSMDFETADKVPAELMNRLVEGFEQRTLLVEGQLVRAARVCMPGSRWVLCVCLG
jgi:hypothetical protein